MKPFRDRVRHKLRNLATGDECTEAEVQEALAIFDEQRRSCTPAELAQDDTNSDQLADDVAIVAWELWKLDAAIRAA